MRSARQSAVRLLQLMMVASLVLPTILFTLSSWISYRHTQAVANERIWRSLDVMHEHALNVFRTVELVILNVNQLVGELSDEQIRNAEQTLHLRLKQLSESLPLVQSIWILDRNGWALAASSSYPVPGAFDHSSRDYFKAHVASDIGTFVGEIVTPPAPSSSAPFFSISRRRATPDGKFSGIIQASVLPRDFRNFYARIGIDNGSHFSLIRGDGLLLARYPSTDTVPRKLDVKTGKLAQTIAENPDWGVFTTDPQSDGNEQRIGYRKLRDFPAYVTAGFDTAATNAEWRSIMASQLIFGLPATILLFAIIGIALQRTRRLHDEAERREAAESALRQSQRLEAIGQLTGGVAHDFNNLLMVVSGSAQRLRRDLKTDKHVRLLDMIISATRRGAALTRQLLAFSRRQTLTLTVIDLTQWLPELREMLERSLRGDVATEVNVPKVSCAVKIDPSELELALLNLAVNARDAMPKGGTLSITIRPVVLKGKATEDSLSGEFAAIRVADTGTGIPSDVLPHVFEPFFTTKEIGKGTGLGLSQVYGFARQAGGTATITSTVGRGTTITLYLPRTHEHPVKPAALSGIEVAPRRSGTVLLVEDNAEVAEVESAYFRQLGYIVKTAASARDALALLDDQSAINLVFSDILMPGGMNGLDLARTVRRRFPQIPVLLSTGYSSSAQDAVRQGFVVLQKPFDLTDLEHGLSEAWKRHEQPSSADERQPAEQDA